ncbi:hypothetical protein A3A37_03065 [Candidatus Kaiserbacteria bacterium RIFCSPLOWO2_01_FULL_52_36]|nr:MAG: hypothetical protein A3A37_03065 [Candidatus Kaiserbacteria bacterium RIFCSPLOWO2_01_FULL_52_36]
MQDKVAIDLLKRLLDKYSLDEDEKQAILTAIGILSWSKLIEGRVSSMKNGRDRCLNDDDRV